MKSREGCQDERVSRGVWKLVNNPGNQPSKKWHPQHPHTSFFWNSPITEVFSIRGRGAIAFNFISATFTTSFWFLPSLKDRQFNLHGSFLLAWFEGYKSIPKKCTISKGYWDFLGLFWKCVWDFTLGLIDKDLNVHINKMKIDIIKNIFLSKITKLLWITERSWPKLEIDCK